MDTLFSSSAELPLLDRISDFVDYHAKQSQTHDALVLGDLRYSYQDLSDKVNAVSRALLASGVKHGDRVATLSPPHPDYFIIFLAAASIGAIWLGMNPKYQRDEYRYLVGDSEPVIILARTLLEGRDYRADLEAVMADVEACQQLVVLGNDPIGKEGITFDAFLKLGNAVTDNQLHAARQAVKPMDPALIVYTSGSTGKPKGAILPHRGLVRCSVVQMQYWGCEPLCLVNYLPINHIGCVGDLSCFALVGGGTLVFQEKFEPQETLKIIEKEKVTWLGGVPTALQMLLAAPGFESFDVSSVQIAMWSGAAAPASLVQQLLKVFPYASGSYGLTETVGSVTFAGPCRDVEMLSETVGRPVPSYDVRVVRRDGTVAQPGEEGEIQVRGDFIMTGYWKKPEATAEAIDPDGWFHTGDLGVERQDGTFKLVGRLKEMFISGGYNVFPREVEKVMEQHPAVAMAAVVPMPDELFGEVGHGFALLEAGHSLDSMELAQFCRERLANYKVPKKLYVEKTFPMLPIGKVDKAALKQQVST